MHSNCQMALGGAVISGEYGTSICNEKEMCGETTHQHDLEDDFVRAKDYQSSVYLPLGGDWRAEGCQRSEIGLTG